MPKLDLRAYVQQRKKEGVFEKIDPKDFDTSGFILFPCSDGYRGRFFEATDHLRKLTGINKIQPVVWAGGLLEIARYPSSLDLLRRNIDIAIENGFDTALCHPHGPCKFARDHDMDIHEVELHTLNAVNILRKHVYGGKDLQHTGKTVRVVTAFHADYEDDVMETYKVNVDHPLFASKLRSYAPDLIKV